jgi:DNA-binding CsgD family transcriptional regulator
LTHGPAPAPLVVAIEIDDPELADRLAVLLSDAPGLRLAQPGETADATLVTARAPVASAAPDGALTPREREVLGHLAEGVSNKTIAHRLGISIHTVKFHVASLIDKLDATGRTDAVAHAARLRVIQL